MTESTIDVHAEVLPGEPFRAEREPDPCTLVIFGITGDLASRKLFPALYNLERENRLPAGARVIGVGRKSLSAEELLRTLRDATGKNSRSKPLDETVWHRLAQRFDY